MPLPFLLVAGAAVAGVTGIAKGAKSVSNNNTAKSMLEDAQNNYKNAENKLENQRTITNRGLEELGKQKLEVWANDMNTFLNYFSLYKNVNFDHDIEFDDIIKSKINNSEFLNNIKIASMNAVEITQAGFASLGSGALAGVASYGGAMMFAHASTGTAIATLSGAAAKNATLAWFGGGALKAGGLGMAGGSMVLGGIVVGPVLAVAGFIMEAKSEENLAKARKAVAEAEQAIEKMSTMTDFMAGVERISNQYYSFINDFGNLYSPIIKELERITEIAGYRQALFYKKNKIKYDKKKIDFNILTMRERKLLHLSWLMTQVYYSILTTPLLTQNNMINENANNVLDSALSETSVLENKTKAINSMRDDSLDFVNVLVDNADTMSNETKLDTLRSLKFKKLPNRYIDDVKEGTREKGQTIWKFVCYILRFLGFLLMIEYGCKALVYALSFSLITMAISGVLCYVNYVMTFNKNRDEDKKKDALASLLVVLISIIVSAII